jgi:cation:H+ antiporter
MHSTIASPVPRVGGPGTWLFLFAALLLPVPWLALRLAGTHPDDLTTTVLTGLAILGAAFVLSWAAEVAQLDISQGLALAVLALIAILPEYAVDAYFAWQAATNPVYAGYALANMTGANRLLIGLGWSMVVLVAAWRQRRAAGAAAPRQGSALTEHGVDLAPGSGFEVGILLAATLYAFILPFKGALTLWDLLVFVGLFVFYLVVLARRPTEAPHLVGPAAMIGQLPPRARRLTVLGLTAFAAVAIFLAAEPFAEGLVHLGTGFGIDEFLLVQWLAPLASESPEFLVAGMFAWRLMSTAGLQTLVSSKVNQWTLLVGLLPLVTTLAAGQVRALPLDGRQGHELWLTAAQSLFAVALLLKGNLTVRNALSLAGLFLAQLLWPFNDTLPSWAVFTGLYLLLVVGLLADKRRRAGLVGMGRDIVKETPLRRFAAG